MIVPRALVHPSQFESAVSEVERVFHPQVVHIRYSLGKDSTGDPAVFFRILLSDDASQRAHLRAVASRVEKAIFQHVEPVEQWGAYPYFNYRSQLEQKQLNEPAWA